MLHPTALRNALLHRPDLANREIERDGMITSSMTVKPGMKLMPMKNPIVMFKNGHGDDDDDDSMKMMIAQKRKIAIDCECGSRGGGGGGVVGVAKSCGCGGGSGAWSCMPWFGPE